MQNKKLFLIIGLVLIVICIVSLFFYNKQETVVFMDGYEVYYSRKVDFNKTISEPQEPKKDGYIFKGWKVEGKLFSFDTHVKENLTLTAVWEKEIVNSDTKVSNKKVKEYVVKFNSDGGTKVTSLIVLKGNTIKKPKDPKKEGYSFVEWQLDGKPFSFLNPIKKNIELKAIWNDNNETIKKRLTEYTVTFNTKGGTKVSSQKVYRRAKAKMPKNPKKEGYSFVEWQLDGKIFSFTTPILEDITLVAKWKKETSVINYELNYNISKNYSPTNVIKDEAIVLPTPTRKGYSFEGWYLDNEFKNKISNVNIKLDKNTTLYAKWRLLKYNISYNLDGGLNPNNLESFYTIEDNIILPIPTKEGCIFDGWYTEETFKNMESKIVKGSTGKKVFYAKWKKEEELTYVVNFKTAGGTNINSQILKPGSKVVKPSDPVKSGAIFIEWQYKNKEYDFNSIVDKDITLTAVYIVLDDMKDGVEVNSKKRLFAYSPSNCRVENIISKLSLTNSFYGQITEEENSNGKYGVYLKTSSTLGTTELLLNGKSISKIIVIPNVKPIDLSKSEVSNYYENIKFVHPKKVSSPETTVQRTVVTPQEFDIVGLNTTNPTFYFSIPYNALVSFKDTSSTNTISKTQNEELLTSIICKVQNIKSNSDIKSNDCMYVYGGGQGQTFIKEPNNSYFWTSGNSTTRCDGKGCKLYSSKSCNTKNGNCTIWGGNNSILSRYLFNKNDFTPDTDTSNNKINTSVNHITFGTSNQKIYSFIAADWDNNLILTVVSATNPIETTPSGKIMKKIIDEKTQKKIELCKTNYANVNKQNECINKISESATIAFVFDAKEFINGRQKLLYSFELNDSNISDIDKKINKNYDRSISRQGIAISGGYMYALRGNWKEGVYIQQYNMYGKQIALFKILQGKKINPTILEDINKTNYGTYREEAQGLIAYNNVLYFGSIHRSTSECTLGEACDASGTALYNIYKIK